MYDELSVLAIRPTEREEDPSADSKFISIVDKYVDICKQYHIYIPKSAQAVCIKLRPRELSAVYNKNWKQQIKNFIKILDKQTVSIIVIDTSLISVSDINNGVAKLYSAIASVFFKCGYHEDSKLCAEYAENRQLVFLGGTDDAHIFKHTAYLTDDNYYIVPADMKD